MNIDWYPDSISLESYVDFLANRCSWGVWQDFQISLSKREANFQKLDDLHSLRISGLDNWHSYVGVAGAGQFSLYNSYIKVVAAQICHKRKPSSQEIKDDLLRYGYDVLSEEEIESKRRVKIKGKLYSYIGPDRISSQEFVTIASKDLSTEYLTQRLKQELKSIEAICVLQATNGNLDYTQTSYEGTVSGSHGFLKVEEVN